MIYSMYSCTEDPLYHPFVIKLDQQFWKRILIVDDNKDVTTTFKVGIEGSNIDTNRKIKVYTCDSTQNALSESQLL
jgi:hypothetical protein